MIIYISVKKIIFYDVGYKGQKILSIKTNTQGIDKIGLTWYYIKRRYLGRIRENWTLKTEQCKEKKDNWLVVCSYEAKDLRPRKKASLY